MYSHTQRGTVPTLAIAAGGALLVVLLFMPGIDKAPGTRVALWVTFVAMLLSLLFFSSMTIRVGEGVLEWHFGPGALGKTVALGDIASAEPTRTSFLSGWGIHLTSRGWLYNVAGRRAVLITLQSGKRFLLGTDEPERLVAAIAAARG